MTISVTAFAMSVTSFYITTFRQTDELHVSISPPLIDLRRYAEFRTKGDRVVETSTTTLEMTEGFAFAYINKGSRDIVVVDAKIVVMPRIKNEFKRQGEEGYCEDDNREDFSVNLNDIGASIKSSEVKVVRPTFNAKGVLFSGAGPALNDKRILVIPLPSGSDKSKKFFVRVCARFALATAGAAEGLMEKDLILYDLPFQKGKIWDAQYTDAITAPSNQLLFQRADGFLSNIF